ncbi:MAG: proton-translocating transhydrogenase family protein [Treponema sp.]
MSFELTLVIVFLVTTVLGYFLIKNVPSLLHTPLMSGMNALSGITVLATMTSTAIAVQVAMGAYNAGIKAFELNAFATVSQIAGVIGIVCATCNVVAGFGLTDRMLKMFKSDKKDKKEE